MHNMQSSTTISPLVIKLGGSVITDRFKPYTLNESMTRRFIRRLNDFVANNPQQPLIVVLGGGSYGHTPVHDFGLSSSRQDAPFFTLTQGLYRLKDEFATLCYDLGFPIELLQSSCLFTARNKQPEHCFVEPLLACFAAGRIPVLTGCPAFDQHGERFIFGSDRIPELLNRMFSCHYCYYVTDKPGIMMSANQHIDCVDNNEQRKSALDMVYQSKSKDVTGGMAGKLASIFELADQGLSSVICSATALTSASDHQLLTGTLTGTRICAPACSTTVSRKSANDSEQSYQSHQREVGRC